MKSKSKNAPNPQAKQLHLALTGMGVSVTACQAAEALARVEGYRTLHVAKAAAPLTNDGHSLRTLAIRLTSRMFFLRSGEWEGKELQLMAELAKTFENEETLGSRGIEARVHELLKSGRGVTVNPAFELLRESEWPAVFDSLVAAATKELGAAVQAPSELSQATVLFSGPVRDWRFGEQELDSKHPHAQPYDTTLTASSGRSQFGMDFLRNIPTDKSDAEGSSVFVEVANGVPVVRLYPDVYGDCALSAFLTKEGVYLVPGYTDMTWKTGAPPKESALADIYEHEAFVGDPHIRQLAVDTSNHRFIAMP